MADWLAVDFGTSNSAAAYSEGDAIRRVHLEPSADTIPTAVFFPSDSLEMDVGSVATTAMVEGTEGRYMRSLKSVLGQSLMAERRNIVGRRVDFYDIISGFLRVIKDRAEAEAGRTFDKVVAGRPVFFDSRNAEADARAHDDLERCYRMAGFDEIVFLAEPEAAALSTDDALGAGGTGLVVDIGGGTSDFSVFRRTKGETQVLASNGLRLGGTNFDRAVNLEFIMPHLGYGHPIRPKMSSETLAAPNAIFVDLATWQKIPFLYDQKTKRIITELVRDAIDPPVFKRLLHAIKMELGHEIAFLAERAKIASNDDTPATTIDLGLVEPGLTVDANAAAFDRLFHPFTLSLSEAMAETLLQAKMGASDITHIVPVGGSSLMRLVRAAMSRVVPGASMVEASIFTAIVDGLAKHSRTL